MEDKENLLEKNWLSFDNEDVKPDNDKENTDSEASSANETSKVEDNTQENSDLQNQIDNLLKQQKDTQSWGRKQRAAYVVTKKKIEELSQKLFDEGTLFPEQLEEIKAILNSSFETEDLKEVENSDNPYSEVINNLTITLEEYKKWNTDKDADVKFQAFFKHLELVTPTKLDDIRKYLSTEEPKIALKYILEEGEKYYGKFYKHVIAKGDAFSYVEELSNTNEKLEKKIKELQEELDQTEGKVYSKSIKSRGSIGSISNKTFESRWGESGNFFDN